MARLQMVFEELCEDEREKPQPHIHIYRYMASTMGMRRGEELIDSL